VNQLAPSGAFKIKMRRHDMKKFLMKFGWSGKVVDRVTVGSVCVAGTYVGLNLEDFAFLMN